MGRLIGAFKTVSTTRINQLRDTPGARFWQRNYYEKIIRNERQLQALRRYIVDNPQQWALDSENPAMRITQKCGAYRIRRQAAGFDELGPDGVD